MDLLGEVALSLQQQGDRTVYAYLRVSSDKQAREGESLEMQEQAVLEYCQRQGLSDPLIIKETGSAGKRLFSLPKLVGGSRTESTDADEVGRPLFMLLLGHATTRKDCDIVVWKLDRFSRFQDEQEVLFQLLQRSRVRLHSTIASESNALSDTPDDPMATLMRQILGAFAQYERALIEMRMTAGLRFKASKGGFTGGKPPYGYESHKGDLRIREDQARLIRYIFMQYRKYGMFQSVIAAQITAHLPDGKKFSKVKVGRIIRNESLYRGQYRDRYGGVHDRPDLKILTHDYDYDYEEDLYGPPEAR